MDLTIERVKVWAASIDDSPGGLAKVLDGLSAAGVDLDFVIARRAPDKPGKGVVFVTPLSGDAQVAAAERLGFHATSSVHSVRVEGPDQAGVCARLAAKIAAAGVNLRGLSGASVGSRFVVYIGLDSAADADRAVEAIKQA